MSGFAGMISLDGAPPDVALLKRMADGLAFRGPDGTHVTTQPGAGFCFTFLRTGPAPQCASQPCTLDGRTWLLGDVRLDGRDDLIRKLEQHGDEISAGATDEELILRTWRRWGEEGITELIGDYAFALWDAEERCLRCWRDLMGARPFFYARTDGWLYFSNTLNVVRLAPGISSELDRHFIGDFLIADWYQDTARTAFRDTSRLPGGRVLRFSERGRVIRQFQFLDIDGLLWLKTPDEYVDRFGMLLTQAVRERLPHTTASIFMSGGLDSTSIAAVAVESAKKDMATLSLRAYTVDCQPLFNDVEGHLASLTAKTLGIPIEIQQGTSCVPYEGWNASWPPMPEPFHEPHRCLALEQIQQAARYSPVAFTGYGGDGVMTGQAWPYLVYLVRALRLGLIAESFGGYILRNRRVPPLRGGFKSRFRKWLGRTDPRIKYPNWLRSSFASELHLRERWKELSAPRQLSHPWSPRAYDELNSGSWATVFETDDSAWTGVSAEFRAPLLDLRIQKFLLRIPPVPLCIDKELLRRAMRGRLPEEVRVRPKKPFDGDLLVHQVATEKWHPLPLPNPANGIEEFVNWKNLREALQHLGNGNHYGLWADLRPVTLLYWLNSVQAGKGFQ